MSFLRAYLVPMQLEKASITPIICGYVRKVPPPRLAEFLYEFSFYYKTQNLITLHTLDFDISAISKTLYSIYS